MVSAKYSLKDMPTYPFHRSLVVRRFTPTKLNDRVCSYVLAVVLGSKHHWGCVYRHCSFLTRGCHPFPSRCNYVHSTVSFGLSSSFELSPPCSLDSTPSGYTNVRGTFDFPHRCQWLLAVSQRMNIYIPLVIVRTRISFFATRVGPDFVFV